MGAAFILLEWQLPGDENCRNAQSGDAGGAFISVTGSVSISSSCAAQFPQITSSPALTFLSTSTSDAQTGHLPMIFNLTLAYEEVILYVRLGATQAGFAGVTEC